MYLSAVLNPLRAEVSSPMLEKMGFKNIPDMFDRSAEENPDKVLALYKIRRGHWGSVSYKEMADLSHKAAAGLLAIGVKKGDRVTFACNNRYEWTTVDIGLHRIGGINVTNYVTPDPEKLVKEEIAFNISNSRSKIAFVSKKYLKRFKEILDSGNIPSIEKVVVLDGGEDEAGDHRLMTFEEFMNLGEKEIDLLNELDYEVSLDDTATIIYTSGSTGVPKGVILTHGNLLSNVENILAMIDLRKTDVELSFLPLGHVFERIINYLLLRMGGTIGYAESIQTIADDALVIQPTVFPAVPRVFEKFKAKVEENAKSKGKLSHSIYKWATRVGTKVSKGNKNPLVKLQYSIAKKIVFDKVVRKLGGKVRFFVSSSAPLAEDTANFFKSMNFEILEAYGMTEAGPLISINRNGRDRIGTVGEFIPELEHKISSDGEILLKSPSIMKGFWERPDAEEKAFFNGWLKTGDIGNVSDDGYLTITDRKKNLIKTSNGKYVPPAPIEDKLISNEWISQAMIIGDKRPHCSAIIVPDFTRLEDYAQKNNIHFSSTRELIKNSSVINMFNDVVLEQTKTFANHEQPKKIILGDREWTWESGELTPTQKVRRTIIMKNFREQIDQLYSS